MREVSEYSLPEKQSDTGGKKFEGLRSHVSEAKDFFTWGQHTRSSEHVSAPRLPTPRRSARCRPESGDANRCSVTSPIAPLFTLMSQSSYRPTGVEPIHSTLVPPIKNEWTWTKLDKLNPTWISRPALLSPACDQLYGTVSVDPSPASFCSSAVGWHVRATCNFASLCHVISSYLLDLNNNLCLLLCVSSSASLMCPLSRKHRNAPPVVVVVIAAIITRTTSVAPWYHCFR